MKIRRTATCGELTVKDVDRTVSLSGWVENYRDHGGVIFIDLFDRWGMTQVVFDPEVAGKETHEAAGHLRSQYVVSVMGEVRQRPEGMANDRLDTGAVEVYVKDLEILNKSKTPPFDIYHSDGVNEETRLKHRYLDLRREKLQKSIIFRSSLMNTIRNYFHDNDFVEIETPVLNKSTPEGARDYLVPSRIHPGSFFALPQSPQLFKQTLMTSGFDKYFQIAKCFRDEDLRADRQPEFTQVDLEMSFVDREDVMGVIEGLFELLFEKHLGKKITLPLQRLTYKEAMLKYGCDAPDLRFGLEIIELSDVFRETEFSVFKNALSKKGVVRGNQSQGIKFSAQQKRP